MGKALDLKGRTFGHLTVIQRVGVVRRTSIYYDAPDPPNLGRAMWLCRCRCGNTHIASSAELTKARPRGQILHCPHCDPTPR